VKLDGKGHSFNWNFTYERFSLPALRIFVSSPCTFNTLVRVNTHSNPYCQILFNPLADGDVYNRKLKRKI